MERRMTGNCHVRCGVGEKMEIASKSYLSLLSQALRKLSGAINKSKTITIFINQIREKVGVMFGNQLVVA